ncbi:MAG: (Fe-S)-binding protein [Burkholderiales bacterium]|nr:(Fe-S)-binding protein [Burkholderiales bacterium]OUT77725.1 MAG: Fe-S oxidoreductase [Betaproteobacteria bacterium TMED22]
MRVGLFVTCLADLMRPSIGLAALELLERAGCEVIFPENQTCCGQPAYNAGDRHTARDLARKVVSEFSDVDYVVIPSGSCGGMIKTHYEDLLGDSPDDEAKVQWLSARTYELTDFLVNVLNVDSFDTSFQGTITYHDSCAGLRELGVKEQPRKLLRSLPYVELKEMPGAEQCCGFGGTFSVKYGDISSRIVDLKCDDVESTEADALVLGDLGCMLNIEGKLRRRGNHKTKVLHIAEVLTGRNGEETE